jgi:fido (protein-threonine AMPylation protein)
MNKLKELWLTFTNPPSAKVLALRELENAKRAYLESKTHQEYYDAQVDFERIRITRLEAYLRAED